MKISEIKDKELRELAELRRHDCQNKFTDLLDEAFDWEESLEGSDFWGDVDDSTITSLPKQDSPKQDSVVQEVIEKMQSRSSVGIEKYGTTLDRKDLTTEQWIDHAIEEAMDFTLYLTKIKRELKK
jgi:hypothetical protein